MLPESVEKNSSAIIEASVELIMPLKRIVEVAMRRVKEGTAYLDLDMQRVYLSSKSGNRSYEIINLGIDLDEDSKEVILRDSLDVGLFIDGIQLNEKGKTVNSLIEIQLPRSVDLVTQDNLYNLRGLNPTDAERLAQELNSASVISIDKYIAAFKKRRN